MHVQRFLSSLILVFHLFLPTHKSAWTNCELTESRKQFIYILTSYLTICLCYCLFKVLIDYLDRSWRKCTAQPEWPHQEVKAECRQRAGQDLGHRPFLESTGRVLGVPRLRLDLSIQTKKRFGKLPGGLI